MNAIILRVTLMAAFCGLCFGCHKPPTAQQTAKNDLAQFKTALAMYEIDQGNYPGTQQGLNALVQAPSGINKWHGPYRTGAIPLDPWGRKYVYRSPGTNGSGYD